MKIFAKKGIYPGERQECHKTQDWLSTSNTKTWTYLDAQIHFKSAYPKGSKRHANI